MLLCERTFLSIWGMTYDEEMKIEMRLGCLVVCSGVVMAICTVCGVAMATE